MVKKTTLLFFSFFTYLSIYAQQIEWAKKISIPIRKSHFINNAFCFTGISNDTLKIDSMFYNWYPHPYSYMASIKKDGTIDNVLHLSDIYPIDFTGDNNAYYISGGQQSFCMSKSELNGNIPWSECYSCLGCSHYPSVAAVSLVEHKNSLYVIGGYEDNLLIGNLSMYTPNKYSSLLTKVNPNNGNVIWAKNIPSSVIKIIDLHDETFLIGTKVSRGTSSFDSISLQVNSYSGIAISRADTSGNFISAKLIAEGDGAEMTNMAIDADKNIFITGTFYDTCKIGTTAYVANGGAVFLLKTNFSGNIYWVKIFPMPSPSVYGTGIFSVCTTPDNSVCITGAFSADTLNFQDTVLVRTGLGPDAFLAKYSSTGQLNYAMCVDASGYCSLNEVTSDDDGALYWWGLFQGQIQIGNYTFQSGYDYSTYLIKISENNTTGVENISKQNILVFPNPSTGIFTVILNKPTSKICVFDVLGNCIMSKVANNNTNYELDLSGQSKGIYFMEILSDGERAMKKIVLQ